MAEQEVRVPDIGDFDTVDVIDVLVKPGDVVAAEDPLITLESDKATMDVPAPFGGKVVTIHVTVGDQVGEGALIVSLEAGADDGGAGENGGEADSDAADAPPATTAATPAAREPAPADDGGSDNATGAAETEADAGSDDAGTPQSIEVRVPDIGDFENVDVIDILVKAGDEVAAEDPLITLESDKATMDVPAPRAGTVSAVETEVGAKVSEGDLIVTLSVRGDGAAPVRQAPATDATSRDERAAGARDGAQAAPGAQRTTRPAPAAGDAREAGGAPRKAHASPSVRRFARELGVDVALVNGTGPKGRILKEDVQGYVKDVMHGTRGQAGGAFALPAAPDIDFSRFGDIETTPLNKIRKLTGQNLHRSWLTVPHVFQMDEADVTELEEFRRSKADEAEKKGTKLTLLAFLVKAAVVALKKYPDFNASLSPDGEALIHKKYFHIGIAVNTEHGLVVPVIRDVDKKGLYELALEARELAAKARERKITPAEMQGACFTISSLGGVGGTHFTPIINTPEVAILGVSPSIMKPVWRDGEFEPRLMLPFTLSYDHRVIDGVAAAQFTRFLTTVLGDIRHILL